MNINISINPKPHEVNFRENSKNSPIILVEPKIIRKISPHLNLFYSFFNLSHFLCIIPFRFHYQKELEGNGGKNGQRIILKSSLIRKLYGIIVYLYSLTIHGHLQNSRIAIVKNRFNVLLYFNIVHTIMHAISFAQICFNLLFRQETFLKVILAVERCRLLQHQSKLKEKYITWLTYLVSSVLLCGLPMLSLLQTMEMSGWNLSRMTQWSLNGALPSFNNTPWKSNNVEYDYSLVGAIFRPPIAWLPYRFLEGFRISACLIHGMLLYTAANNFVGRNLNNVDGQDCEGDHGQNRKEDLLDDYRNLKGLAECVNGVWGWTFFIALVDYILWFTTDFNSDLKENGWTGRITQVWFCLGMISLLVLGAETSRKMSTFKAWMVTQGPCIFENCPEEKTNFMEALEKDGVWIGKHGLYQLNYGFLGQVAVLVITLFIITLQYELSSTHS